MTRLAQVSTPGSPSAAFTSGLAPGGWTPGRIAAAAALLVAGWFATRDAWADIYDIAVKDEEASHIFLVPIIFGWLIWARRDRLATLVPGNSLVGPLLIAIGGLVNWYGFYHYTQAAWHAGAVLVAVGGFLTVAGWRYATTLLPAFAVLAFLVPIPGMIRQEIAIPMQRVTASITEVVYQALAFDIARQGNVLYFNGEPIAVAEACNGMRMIFALILVTYGVVFATPLRAYVRVLLLVLSPFFAVLCNVIRLLPTVWLYGYYPKTWGPLFHDISGWVMIAVAFAMLMGLIQLLRWAYIPVMQPGHEPELEEES